MKRRRVFPLPVRLRWLVVRRLLQQRSMLPAGRAHSVLYVKEFRGRLIPYGPFISPGRRAARVLPEPGGMQC